MLPDGTIPGNLERRGFREGEDLVVVIEEGAEHNEMAWARRIHVPLTWVFGTDR
ncbi:MAG: hypothetical protein ACE5GH_00220 [Fidelibacterota bacterium]